MKKFEYFVGVNPKDKEVLDRLLNHLCEIDESNLKIKKLYEFTDPSSYFICAVEGTEANFNLFSAMKEAGDYSIIKLLDRR